MDATFLQRLHTQGRDGWNAWEEQTRQVEAKYTEVRWIKGPDASFAKDPHYDFEMHFFYAGDRCRNAVSKLLPDGRRAEVLNVFRGGDYSFSAERNDSGALVATEVRMQRRPEDLGFPPGLTWPISIEHRDLRELLDDPSFDITALRQEGAYVRVEFTAATPVDEGRPERFTSGQALLDPDLNWAVRSYDVARSRGRVRLENKFGARQGDLVPIVQTVRFLGAGAKEVWDFSVYRANEKPDSFYTFEAVGLPNLARRSGAGMTWFWIMNGGAVCLLLAWWIRRQLAGIHR